VVDHVVEGDGDRRVEAEHDLRERVADQDDVDARRVDERAKR
jgi:hypothetical protein